MKIIIHQALFGDKNGPYDLLRTTHPDYDAVSKIRSTDLHDRPTDTIKWSPVYRGIPHQDFYLLCKTYKDQTPSVRNGRVFTHALLIPLEHIGQVNNLDILSKSFPLNLDKDVAISPIEYDTKCDQVEMPQNVGRFNVVIKGLGTWGRNNNTIIWVGKDGFESMINSIWSTLWDKVRRDFHFGVGFEPREVNTTHKQILWVPEVLETKWNSSGFLIVRKTDHQESLTAESELLLSGRYSETSALKKMIAELEIELDSTEGLVVLDKVVDTYSSLNKQQSFTSVLLLADILKTYSPLNEKGAVAKNRIISHLARLCPKASIKEIVALQKLDLTPFHNGVEKLAPALSSWIVKNILKCDAPDAIVVIDRAISKTQLEFMWWNETVIESLCTAFKKWSASSAIWIWKICGVKPALVLNFKFWVPEDLSTGQDLAKSFPNNFTEELHSRVLEWAQERNWLDLHARVLSKNKDKLEAFRQQLAIDRDANYDKALRIIAKACDKKDVVDSAIILQDERLFQIAAEGCRDESRLLSGMDILKTEWRILWTKALKSGMRTWDGIEDISAVWQQFIDLFFGQKNEESDVELLSYLAKDKRSHLLDYPERAKVWQRLPREWRQEVLMNTVDAWYSSWRGKSHFSDGNLEIELSDLLFKQSVVSGYIRNGEYHIEFFLDLINSVNSISENLLIELLEHRFSEFTEVASESLGRLLIKKHWRNSYDVVKTKYVRTNHNFAATIRLSESAFEYSFYDFFAQGAKLMTGMVGLSSASRNSRERLSSISDVKNKIILILTALPKEYHAIRAFLDSDTIRKHDGEGGVKYESGIFSDGRSSWEIAIATTGANNYSSSTECQKAISYFKPQYAMFSGIAGGIKDVSIGDVVVVNKLCGYEPGKSANSFSSRIEPGQSNYALQKGCEHIVNTKDVSWRERIKVKKPKGFRSKPNLIVAPVASGEQVVASTSSLLYNMIRERCNDAIAVEMEGVGFYNACRSTGTPAIMVRGISDLLDDKSAVDENDRQQYAAATAAAFTFELISQL